MPNTTIVACKLGQEFETSRKRKQFENGQGAYQVLVSTQLKGKANQTHGISSKVTIPISRP
jgi:hypothetical protein